MAFPTTNSDKKKKFKNGFYRLAESTGTVHNPQRRNGTDKNSNINTNNKNK